MYLYLSLKYMYLKSFFIQKYPLLIWLCIHFLQSPPRGRGRPSYQRKERTPPAVASKINLWPSLLPLYSEEVGGGRSYIFFCFPQLLLFISWPRFNSIFHNWLYSPVAKTLDLSLRSLPKSHGSNPGQDKILKIYSFLALGA